MPVLTNNRIHGRGRLAALFALLVIAGVGLLAAPPNSEAKSVNFCSTVSLAPYGHPGDRCWGPGSFVFGINLVTYDRAGCVTVANGANQLLQSWTCGAAGSVPGPAVVLNFGNDGVWRKPVIRNNNLSFAGTFSGGLACYSGC